MKSPVDPEAPNLDFGRLAVEQGVLREEQLDRCRKLQEIEQSGSHPPPSIEDIALRQQFLTPTQAKAVRLALDRRARDAEKRRALDIPGYALLEVLGEGGLGTVYKAKQVRMNRVVALKVLHKQWVQDDEFRKRFLLEARIVGKMSHQNLVQVFDVGKEDGHYYFSMEYLDNETVEDLIRARGRLLEVETVNIALQVARALKYIKEFGLVHRDIKPSNMLMGQHGVVKLGDFGFVQSHLDKELGYDDMVLGTPDYIAPEQAMGKAVDFRADIYALGASMYHMLTGTPPFSGSGSVVMEKHVKERIPSPRALVPDLSEQMEQLLERMMAKKPEDRYQEFDDLFVDLERVRAGQRPQTERLESGRSTIIRALQKEQGQSLELRSENAQLHQRIAALQRLLWIIAGVAGVGFVATLGLLVALLLSVRGGAR